MSLTCGPSAVPNQVVTADVGVQATDLWPVRKLNDNGGGGGEVGGLNP